MKPSRDISKGSHPAELKLEQAAKEAWKRVDIKALKEVVARAGPFGKDKLYLDPERISITPAEYDLAGNLKLVIHSGLGDSNYRFLLTPAGKIVYDPLK